MYVKGENPLPFEKWIFRYGQPVRDDYRSLSSSFFVSN